MEPILLAMSRSGVERHTRVSESRKQPTFSRRISYETQSDRNKPDIGVLPCVRVSRSRSFGRNQKSRQGDKPTGCLEAGAKPNTYVLKNVSEQTAAGSETKP